VGQIAEWAYPRLLSPGCHRFRSKLSFLEDSKCGTFPSCQESGTALPLIGPWPAKPPIQAKAGVRSSPKLTRRYLPRRTPARPGRLPAASTGYPERRDDSRDARDPPGLKSAASPCAPGPWAEPGTPALPVKRAGALPVATGYTVGNYGRQSSRLAHCRNAEKWAGGRLLVVPLPYRHYASRELTTGFAVASSEPETAAYLIGQFRAQDVDVTAMCVYEPRLQAGLKAASPGAQAHFDYRRLLEEKSLDAVVRSTPPDDVAYLCGDTRRSRGP
jgi:hypothetical protein